MQPENIFHPILMMFAEKCCNIENNSFGKKKEKKEKRHELNLFQKEKNS